MRWSKPSATATMRAERAGRRFPDAAAAAVAACALLAAGAAGAQCAAPAERAIAIDASIAVPRDRPAGSVLYAADYPLPAPAPGCAEAAQDGGWRYAQTPHPSQAEDIYRTGVAAIGVRLSIDGRPFAGGRVRGGGDEPVHARHAAPGTGQARRRQRQRRRPRSAAPTCRPWCTAAASAPKSARATRSPRG